MAPKNKVQPTKKAASNKAPARAATPAPAKPVAVAKPAAPVAQPKNTPQGVGGSAPTGASVALAKTAPAESTAIALPSTVPAWLAKQMEGQAPRGLEHVDRDDLMIPRIVLAQALSPEVVSGALRSGALYDNLSKEQLAAPDEDLVVIPITFSKSRIYFQAIDEGGGILCRSDDSLKARPNGIGKDQGENPTQDCGACVLKEWDDTAEGKDAKPGCSILYNFLVLLPQFGMRPMVLSMKSTSIKVAKRFLSAAKQTGADFFAIKYAIKSVAEHASGFDFKNYTFASLGWVSPEEYAHASSYFAGIDGKVFTPDVSDLEGKPHGEDAEEFVQPSNGATAQEMPPPPTDADAPEEADAF